MHIPNAFAASSNAPQKVVQAQDGQNGDIKKKKKKTTPEELNVYEPAAGITGAGVAGAGAAAGGSTLLGVAALAAIGIGVAAAAGGGGGGGGGGSSTAPKVSTDPTEGAFGDEVLDSTGLATINASAAYDRGYTGAGISVGIMDTGLRYTHQDLDDQIQDCYRAFTDEIGCDKIDVRYHGGHVAGIALAEKNDFGMHGVAYNADLYNADIFIAPYSKSYGVDLDRQANAVDWLVGNGVKVINNSYGIPGSYEDYTSTEVDTYYGPGNDIYDSYLNAVNNDVIMVWSAGNSAKDDPGITASLPLFYSEFAELWVATVAVSTNGGVLSSYSNKCGDASAFCIAAPGGEYSGASADGGIFSVSDSGEDRYTYAAGTSMAAPHVTGSLAVMLEAFGPGTSSNLTAEEIVDLMYATANKTGIYADSTIYGQGLLDLDAATAPGAPLLLATGTSFTSGATPLSGSSITFGPSFGDAPTSVFSDIKVGAHDKYGRIFSVSLNDLAMSDDSGLNSAKILSNFGNDKTQTLNMNNSRISVSYANKNKNFLSSPMSQGESVMPGIQALSFSHDLNKSTAFDLYYGQNMGQKFGLQKDGSLNDSLLAAHDQSVNPYLDFVGEKGISTGMTKTLKNNVEISAVGFSVITQKSDPLLNADHIEHEQDQVMGTAVEAAFKPTSKFNVSGMFGTIQEDENVLGTSGAGAFGMDSSTPTVFAGVNLNYQINDKVSLMGGYQTGWTNADAAENSLFSDFSTIRSDSFTAGLTGHDAYKKDDKWGLFVHQPLRVNKAEATINLPYARDDSGAALFSRQNIDLEPTGREMNFQAFYTMPIEYSHKQKEQELSFGATYRMEPGHNKYADPEGIGLVRYKVKF